jgi:hypothetical protein
MNPFFKTFFSKDECLIGTIISLDEYLDSKLNTESKGLFIYENDSFNLKESFNILMDKAEKVSSEDRIMFNHYLSKVKDRFNDVFDESKVIIVKNNSGSENKCFSMKRHEISNLLYAIQKFNDRNIELNIELINLRDSIKRAENNQFVII